MEENKKKFFWLDIIFFIVLLAVGGYFFWKSAPEATAPDNVEVTSNNEVSTDLPEGVTVEDLGDGEKLVKNEKDGYEVKVSKNYYLYKDLEGKNLKIQDYIEPEEAYAGSGGCLVSFSKLDFKNIDIVKKEENTYCKDVIGIDCEYSKVEEININNIKWFKVYSHGNFVGTDNPQYITYKEKDMYVLYFSCVDNKFLNNILNNFSF